MHSARSAGGHEVDATGLVARIAELMHSPVATETITKSTRVPYEIVIGAKVRKLRALIAVALVAGCSANYPESPSPTPTLAGIRIHYPNPHVWINPGQTTLLALYAIDTQGVYQAVTPSAATWFSSSTGVATVNNGSVRGVAGGDVDIVVSYRGFTATARVVILDPAVRFPWLDIRSLTNIETGATSRASALYFETASSSRNVNDQATWTSSDHRVFTVEAGQVKAVGPGTAYVTATYNGLTATVFASVPPLRRLP
jgi:hypothetical protein